MAAISAGSGSNQGREAYGEGSPASELAWEDKVRTLRDIVTTAKYPCIVKVKSGDVGKYRDGGKTSRPEGRDQVDGDVLHIIEMRRHKMVVCVKLQWDRRTDEHTKTDAVTDINVTQKGWFEVLPENGQPVEYFDTINAIVGIRPKQFLVRTSIVGYQLSVDNGASSWVPWEIRPGEVLKTGIIHMDQKKVKKKSLLRRIFSSGKAAGAKEQEIKYLQCFDSDNREIMVPLIMTGLFSPVGDSSEQNYDAVYTLHDLISAFNLPIKAQLIHTDARGAEGIPSGTLSLERLRDSETVLVADHPYIEGKSNTFEIPLNQEFQIVKERKRKLKRQSLVNVDNMPTETLTETLPNGQIDLPIRVKDANRKSKGSGILEKLSVRSKSKKERASIKALAEEGIFSSRLSKSGMTFDDFYNDETEPDYDNVHSRVTSDDKCKSDKNYKTNQDVVRENGYAVVVKRERMQDRDLPPIPNKSKTHVTKRSPENEYEELPIAPRPPEFFINNGDEQDDHDDGYMTPARFRELNESSTTGEFDVIVKRKPPTAPRDSVRYTRARKAKSEYSSHISPYDNEADNIEQYFEFALADNRGVDSMSESPYDRRRAGHTHSNQHAKTMSPFQGRRFTDDSALDNRSLNGFVKMKSRSQKNLALESNATVRSHNVRRMRTAMDVFNFSDSLKDLRQPFQNGVDGQMEPTYGRVVDDERIKSYVYGEQNPYARTPNYVESEPAYRRYNRTSSNAALNDSYPKHGDDSAISMCSRGEYGTMLGESEYSYSEYSEWHDDGWIPPDSISNLSVLEVSKSLRYIGMKDRVVIRFAREQIDGNMLSSLDVKLLREGFPELNAFDIKKVLDFVGGWRPKK